MLSTITTGAAEEISAPETIKASGQARGTFLVTVQAVATTTTKGSITATTEAPTTTEATIIITTAKPTTTGIVETYSVSSDIVTEDTTAQTTTAEVKQTAAADTIEAMTSSAVATEDPTQTNTTEAEPVTTSEASCGPHGENSISLTIPAVACETGAKSTGKSHGQPEGDSQGHSGDKSYPMPRPNEQAKPEPTHKQHIHTVSEGVHGEIESHSAYQEHGQPSVLPHKDFPTSNDKHPIYPTAVHDNSKAAHTETPQRPAQHGPNGQGQGGFSKTYITQALTVAAKTHGSNSTTLYTRVLSYEPNSPITAAGAIKFSSGSCYLASVVCRAALLLAA